MVDQPDFTPNSFKSVVLYPVLGYPLLLSWKKGWLPAPQRTAQVRLRDSRTLRCDLSDFTQRTMALGLFEPAETRIVKEILKPGDTFIDVGAHIGWFTTIASRQVGPDGTVIACEPYPPNAAVLRENLALNGARNVRLVEMALGGEPGELSLTQASDSGSVTAVGWGRGHNITARMTTLDEVATEAPVIALLKMDVEGWEPHVLRGGSATFRRARHVLFEINKPALEKAGSSPDEVYSLLRDAGFVTFVPVAQPGLRRLISNDRLVNVLASR